jgi:hypothetical protein
MEMTLFAIEQELKALFEDVSSDVELPDEEKQIQLSKLNAALTQKTDQVAAFRESLCAFVEYLNQKIDEMETRKKQYENKIARFDDYVLNCLSIQEKKELVGNLYKISKRKPSQVVEIYDESKIPIEFVKIPEPKPTIMKAEIAKAIKQGEIVDGARLVDGKTTVTYKLK